jgi:hypothetical protein
MAGLFGPVEEIRVKGRQGPIALSRRLFARETLQREVERYRSF